jgi:hypothetical protein
VAEQINKPNRSCTRNVSLIDVDSESTITGNRLQENYFRRWLSPPDPSTNQNIARKVHHNGTALWFTKGDTFKEWEATGSLLWIHGNRMYTSQLRASLQLMVSRIVA